MNKIMIVEDDITLNKGIMLTLSQDDMDIKQAFDLKESRIILKENKIDLIILDVNLPDGNGFDFCKEVKEKYDASVIFLTACDMEIDEVTGLQLGADDYITKPFSLMVLRARVMNILRRQIPKSSINKIIVNNMVFDFDEMKFTKGNNDIILSKTEQKLLRILITNKGNILTRGQLIDRIWTDEAEYVDENALTVTIKRLRAKVEDKPSSPKYIKTIYGIGYTWSGGGDNE